MSNAVQIAQETGNDNFYPTPDFLIDKMIESVDWSSVGTVLEPSAGKGNIIKRIYQKVRYFTPEIDAIEKDDYIRSILKYELSEEKRKKLLKEYHVYDDMGWEEKQSLPYEKVYYYKILKEQIETQEKCAKYARIVHDDFLTYTSYKQYKVVIMNPPFSDGDKHLLKAIDMQKYGGSIVCLLNAETLRNPYSNSRKSLVKKLSELNASVEFIDDAFEDAERKTDVSVALIKIDIPEQKLESDIFKRMQEASEYKEADVEYTDIELTDFFEMIVNRYNVEIRSGIEIMNMAKALRPYISYNFDDENSKPILDFGITQNEYIVKTRNKYWKALLYNDKFIGRLTEKLKMLYRDKIEELQNYEFNIFNIKQIAVDINASVVKGIEGEISDLYDKLTAEHSWYPETKNNVHYYDGWATNKAHKIGKKVILPNNGFEHSYFSNSSTFNVRKAYGILSDIELTLNYFAGDTVADVDLYKTLEEYKEKGITKNIPLKYFNATFYKKGTVHLVFTNMELIDRFNIYVGKNRNWLPPHYGRAAYKDMNEKEKSVIDKFQGESEYNKILANAAYYLAPVVNSRQMLLLDTK